MIKEGDEFTVCILVFQNNLLLVVMLVVTASTEENDSPVHLCCCIERDRIYNEIVASLQPIALWFSVWDNNSRNIRCELYLCWVEQTMQPVDICSLCQGWSTPLSCAQK